MVQKGGNQKTMKITIKIDDYEYEWNVDQTVLNDLENIHNVDPVAECLDIAQQNAIFRYRQDNPR